jgi:hypothetical protein
LENQKGYYLRNSDKEECPCCRVVYKDFAQDLIKTYYSAVHLRMINHFLELVYLRK